MSGYGQSNYDGASPYGQQPGFGAPALAGPVEQPSSIRTAVKLMRTGVLLSLFSLLVALLALDDIDDAVGKPIRAGNTALPPEAADAGFAVAVGILVVVGLCEVLLWLWMAGANGSGRSWARVVASILFGIHVISTLGDLSEPQPAFSFVMLALGAVIMVLLWQRESTAYYNAVTASRVRH